MQVLFLQCLFSSGVFSHIFAIANQILGLSIIRLANVESLSVFFKRKYKCEYKILKYLKDLKY